MKNSLLSLLSGICLTIVSTNAFAGSEQIDIGLTIAYDEEEIEDRPSKGQRIPAAPIICTIDFENHRIESSIPYEIVAYELWDEDGSCLIVSYPTDYDLVCYISGICGVFRLRIVTSERNYIGYLEL